jgi:hypothetical protein
LIALQIFFSFQANAEGEDLDKKYRPFEKQKLSRSSQKKQVFAKPIQKANFIPEKTKSSGKKEDQPVLEPVMDPILEPVSDQVPESIQEPENTEVKESKYFLNFFFGFFH